LRRLNKTTWLLRRAAPPEHGVPPIGHTVLRHAIKECRDWLLQVYVHVERTDAPGPAVIDQRAQRYQVFDRFHIDLILPSLGLFYYAFLPTVRVVTQQDAVVSPHERSAYSVKLYRPPNGVQGWQYDSNGITVLLYLTDNPRSGTTIITGVDSKECTVSPEADSIRLMRGRECYHRAAPVSHAAKVV